jgi:hypothetical protein
MTTNERRQQEMFQRVAEFGRTHRDRFSASGAAASAFAAVAAAAQIIGEQSLVPSARSTEGARLKAATRAALANSLMVIARTARPIASDTPAIADVFLMPRPRSDSRLLIAGRQFARDAEKVSGRFIALGLPEDFIASLLARVDDLERARGVRDRGIRDNVAARTRIGIARASAFAAIRRLDIIVANALRDDPALLAVWKRDRKVDYLRRARRPSSHRRKAASASE